MGWQNVSVFFYGVVLWDNEADVVLGLLCRYASGTSIGVPPNMAMSHWRISGEDS